MVTDTATGCISACSAIRRGRDEEEFEEFKELQEFKERIQELESRSQEALGTTRWYETLAFLD